MEDLKKAILAGILIGIGGTIYLSLDNKIVGAFLFGIGLFVIVVRQLNLFTGKIGYLIGNKLSYFKLLGITLLGNFIGTFLVGFILRFTRIYTLINEKALTIINTKLDDNLISILILSIFCGLLMYLAVDGFKTTKEDIGKYAGVFLGVIVFILCGFEHCIANMYYFAVANVWSFKVLLYLLVMIVGNSLGSFIFPLLMKAKKNILK